MKQIFLIVSTLFAQVSINAQTGALPQDSIPFAAVQLPEFPGGDTAFSRYLLTHLDYSSIDHEKFDYGKSVISFVVEADGSVSEKELKNSSGESVLLKTKDPFVEMPVWKPAVNDQGEPIRYRITIPMFIDP